MKNYIKPSIELTKFDVEDIITVSGTVTGVDGLTAESAAIYTQYLTENGKTSDETTKVVEFLW